MEKVKAKTNSQRADKFKAENLKLGRKPRNMYTTLEEHEHLKKELIKFREDKGDR